MFECLSADVVDGHEYGPEFAYGEQPDGFPPHKLTLKRNMLLTLVKDIDPTKGLRAGADVVCEDVINQRILKCTTVEGGTEHFLPRMTFKARKTAWLFGFSRVQFPVIPGE